MVDTILHDRYIHLTKYNERYIYGIINNIVNNIKNWNKANYDEYALLFQPFLNKT